MAVIREGLPIRVAACLKRYLGSGNAHVGKRLTVGYSGGLDSSVLLHLLASLRESAGFSLNAVHVHHGLSSQADAWVRHCEQISAELNVPLTLHRVVVTPSGEGLEAAARAARYAVFARLDTDILVLAHHRDDQVETVLLQLLRGAGLKGAAAMPEARLLSPDLVLLRPLLSATRAEISSYAAEFGLTWVEDASNADIRLTRNALRHDVLPVLCARFPDAQKSLVQAAAQFAEAAALLDDLADMDGRDAISDRGLLISTLRNLTEARARNLLRRFLEKSGVQIHQESVREALRQLCCARQDAQVSIAFGAVTLHRYRQWAVLEKALQKDNTYCEKLCLWQGETCLELDGKGRLLFQPMVGGGLHLIPGKVTIRQRNGGEQMRPGPGRPRRTLKNLLREAGIPAWQRAAMPLLYLGENLVWAAGIGADSDYLAKTGEPGWLISWQAPPNKAT